jgi:Fibronectin type III domain
MRKVLALFSALALVTSISPAHAAPAAPTNVGAYFKVEQGYMVNWSLPTSTTGITGYTVTASNGKTCKNSSAVDNQCTFPSTGFKPFEPYTFTVVANSNSGDSAPSAPSNKATWTSAPGYPAPVLTKAISDTQVDVEWVPSTSTGGIANYGYKVIRWEATLNAYGDPKNDTRVDNLVSGTYLSATGLKPSTWYVFAVQQCNALGCSTSDWSYVATTPKVGAALTWRPPYSINGGNAATTCWNAVLDGGTAATTGTFTKAATKCGAVVIDPAQYPKIDPSATVEQIPNLVNKFTQAIFLGGWQNKYSLATWQKLGLTLTPYLSLSSKSVMRGFLIQPVITSNTPAICTVSGMVVNMLKVGTCTITASAPGNNIWQPSRAMTNSFEITA